MFPAAFEYYRATSVQEAVSLLQQHGDNARLLAGGHSLVPLMKLRLAQPQVLVDIGRIPDLRGIRRTDGSITIGALTTHRMVETSDVLKADCPIMPEAAALIGDPQVRNKGTIGGSLAHADPAADMPAVVLALDAELVAQGAGGSRPIKAGDFFVDMLTTALRPGEMLTEVRVPVLSRGTGSAYSKFPHPASRYAVVGVAAVVGVDGSGKCTTVRVAVTGATPKAVRLHTTEQALYNQPLTDRAIVDACAGVPDGLDLIGDIFASADYRGHLVQHYAVQALSAAAARARGE